MLFAHILMVFFDNLSIIFLNITILLFFYFLFIRLRSHSSLRSEFLYPEMSRISGYRIPGVSGANPILIILFYHLLPFPFLLLLFISFLRTYITIYFICYTIYSYCHVLPFPFLLRLFISFLRTLQSYY